MTAFTPDELVAIPRVDAVTASPDGQFAVAAVRRLDSSTGKYISDLWRLDLVTDQSPHRLTRGESQDVSPSFTHDGRLLFLSNRSTDDGSTLERSQVFCLPPLGGEPYSVTDLPLGVSAFECAANADRIVCKSQHWPNIPVENQRRYDEERAQQGPTAVHYRRGRVRHWDHYRPETQSVVIVTSHSGEVHEQYLPSQDCDYDEPGIAISSNGRLLAVSTATLGTDRHPDVYVELIDTLTGTRRELGHEPGTTLSAPRFSPDDQRIYCERNTRSTHNLGKLSIVSFSVSEADCQEHTAHIDQWTTLVDFDLTGANLWFAAPDAGSRRVFSIPCKGGTARKLTPAGWRGEFSGVSRIPGTNTLLGLYSTFVHPPEVITKPPNEKPIVMSYFTGFDGLDDKVQIQELWSQTENGARIQSWLLLPPEAKCNESSIPGVVWIHGGPQSQWTNCWHWRANMYTAVQAGFAVLAPNPTGSLGFGQELTNGIWGNTWGDQCYKDIMAATDAFCEHPGVDKSRISVMGASFGGYMTNWIGTQTSRFRALVTHAGLFDLISFQPVTDYPTWWILQMGGIDPYLDPIEYSKHSPRQHIHQTRTPTLITHGDKDYRVPVDQSLALFEALQHHKVPAELIIFPEENHFIERPTNAVAWYEAIFDFLHRNTR